ncbi:autotransporter strand-loop-strand O-heptosyltransferase [archaeon]|nr:autotransporter strand-loop-strand O-heptosyltransferase [archaeon]NDB54366.1 autotransporter strand-loop-strand O-heptosyltransferase [archaeon]
MKEQLLKNYFDTPFKVKPVLKQKNTINISFKNGPFVEIFGPLKENYDIEFQDRNNFSTVHSTTINNGMWASCSIKYFLPWRIKIKSDSYYNQIDLNLKNQRVCIVNESGSLGDTIAWMDSIKKFQEKHDCIIDYYTNLSFIFDKNYYKNINFFNYPEFNDNKYLYVYKIGCFKPFGPNHSCSKDWRTLSLSDIANEILGLPYGNKPPELLQTEKKVNIKKTVCIATQSTAQAKYWNNKDGWQNVVNYLNSLGYEVVCIDKERSFGSGHYFNNIPDNCTDKTGDINLAERIKELRNCDFFIGLGSGLSWLAWACKKPVILISGFSNPNSEFYTPYRVHNDKVCNSCWNNTKHEFNAGDWLWCPEHKNDERIFECSKLISFDMVKEKIDTCIRDINK